MEESSGSSRSDQSIPILRHKHNSDYHILSVLIVANYNLGKLLKEALQEAYKKENLTKINMVICEDLNDILQFVEELHIDFIVFVIDPYYSNCIREIEINIQRLDKLFLCGRTMLVNGNPYLPPVDMNITPNAIEALKRKYQMISLNGDIKNTERCAALAEQILRVITVTLGFNHSMPLIPWLTFPIA